MPVILGGPKARKVWSRGEFGLSLQYINDEEALCIWPLRSSAGAGAMVILLSAAHLYANSKSGGPTDYLIKRCVGALAVMKMQPQPWTIRKLADIVLDELPELLKMKPEPADDKLPEVDVDIRGNHMKLVIH